MTAQKMEIATPRWSVPMLQHKRFKGEKGGRGSGKSHERAEALVEQLVVGLSNDPNLQAVCVREIQKSLKYSAKKLIEQKISDLGVGGLFEITQTEIRRRGGDGLVIFIGMQDHTADSIKSLEGFDIVWCEEAQSLSHRSIELLTPTFRQDHCELWFTWNPDDANDAVEKLFRDELGVDDIEATKHTVWESEDCVLVHVNIHDNPFAPDVLKKEAEKMRKRDYEAYSHVWLGGYNRKSDAQVFKDKWRVDEFEPQDNWDGPYYGIDFGFSSDPSCFVRCWIGGNTLYIDQDAGKVGLELDNMSTFFQRHDPKILHYTNRADSARPETISYLSRHGLPRIVAVKKWPGSVEDGVEFIKSFDEIVIHTRCADMQEEARLYSYKVDKKSGDILPDIVDAWNHRWDAVRYALQPLIKQQSLIFESLD